MVTLMFWKRGLFDIFKSNSSHQARKRVDVYIALDFMVCFRLNYRRLNLSLCICDMLHKCFFFSVVNPCDLGYFPCGNNSTGSGMCLAGRYWCDGKIHCPDGLDEDTDTCGKT